jgi:L-ascorbate metabolism protein UlaG (beta-lactamase superfamily)
MKLLKADNYQTWFIEEADQGVLIDPWLSNQLQPDNSIFIQRKRKSSKPPK